MLIEFVGVDCNNISGDYLAITQFIIPSDHTLSISLYHPTELSFETPFCNFLHNNDDRELPRVLMIYDIDMPMEKAKSTIRTRFYDNKDIKDQRVVEMLVETGYFALETSMLQHKQKNHLMHFLEGYTIPMEAARKRLDQDSSIEEQFFRN